MLVWKAHMVTSSVMEYMRSCTTGVLFWGWEIELTDHAAPEAAARDSAEGCKRSMSMGKTKATALVRSEPRAGHAAGAWGKSRS